MRLWSDSPARMSKKSLKEHRQLIVGHTIGPLLLPRRTEMLSSTGGMLLFLDSPCSCLFIHYTFTYHIPKYVYIYIACICISIYIYIHRKRDRDRYAGMYNYLILHICTYVLFIHISSYIYSCITLIVILIFISIVIFIVTFIVVFIFIFIATVIFIFIIIFNIYMYTCHVYVCVTVYIYIYIVGPIHVHLSDPQHKRNALLLRHFLEDRIGFSHHLLRWFSR